MEIIELELLDGSRLSRDDAPRRKAVKFEHTGGIGEGEHGFFERLSLWSRNTNRDTARQEHGHSG